MNFLDSCAFEQCPFGQHCTIEDRSPYCNCNISCSGMIDEPVCGERNNKHYKNECELRKEECRIGKRIGIAITPCRGEICLIWGTKSLIKFENLKWKP